MDPIETKNKRNVFTFGSSNNIDSSITPYTFQNINAADQNKDIF